MFAFNKLLKVFIPLSICPSITTCAYIFAQFLKLSPQESLQDPIYHALLRHSSKYVQRPSGILYVLAFGEVDE